MISTLRTMWTKVAEGLARRRAARRHAHLLAVIERQILPRLVIATGSQSLRGERRRDIDPTPENVQELARLLIEHEPSVASEYLQVLRTQGASVESLWMQLVAPTARHLNELSARGVIDAKRITQAQHSLHVLLEELETRHVGGHSRAAEPAGEFSPGA